jgi:hypothetical protein
VKCPIATQDTEVNLKNRNHAFEEYGYGPANPEKPGNFWDERAEEWNTTPEIAQSMRCGNCAAFIQTPEMMRKQMLQMAKYNARKGEYEDDEEGREEDS